MSTIKQIQESIQITNEDNMELMARYEDNYFDLAIVDPPYGIGINHNMGRRKGDKSSDYDKVNWDNEIPSKEYFDELKRVSKHYIIWGGNYFTEHLEPSNAWIIWHKMNDGLSFSMCEMAYTNLPINTKLWKMYNKQQNRIHPTQKPIALYQYLLINYAEKGYKILDTHVGSGSIAISVDSVNKVEKMELTLVGCEIDKKMYEKSMLRIKEKTSWQSLF